MLLCGFFRLDFRFFDITVRNSAVKDVGGIQQRRQQRWQWRERLLLEMCTVLQQLSLSAGRMWRWRWPLHVVVRRHLVETLQFYLTPDISPASAAANVSPLLRRRMRETPSSAGSAINRRRRRRPLQNNSQEQQTTLQAYSTTRTTMSLITPMHRPYLNYKCVVVTFAYYISRQQVRYKLLCEKSTTRKLATKPLYATSDQSIWQSWYHGSPPPETTK